MPPAAPRSTAAHYTAAHYTADYLRLKGLAEKGNAHAQHVLGFMYFNGQGIEQS